MLRRLGIRGKVLAALSVPVLVLFMLAGLTSWQAVQEVQSTRAVQQVLDALEQTRVLTEALQAERAASIALFGPRAAEITDLEDLRAGTDRALTRFRSNVADIDMAALDSTTAEAFGNIDNQLGRLNSARSFVDVGQVPMLTIDRAFGSLIAGVTAFPDELAQTLSDRQLAVIVSAGSGVAQLIEAHDHERALGVEVLSGVQADARDDGAITALSDLIIATDTMRLDIAADVFELRTETPISEVVLSTNLDPTPFPQWRRDLRNLAELRLGTIAPQEWSDSAQTELDQLAVVEAEIAERAESRAATVANATIRDATLTIAATVAAVVLSIIVALSIARSIVRPLRRLTTAADTVRDELRHLVEQVAIPGQGPDLALTTIPVNSRDEVGRLAAAFNEVNSTTIEVAQEQAALRASIAEMFVNVARRDQVLLNRQLSFIDALERSEEDPKTLADLFRLDHLATRMRRNAESLLVLAGIDTGRRLRGTLPTSDVIRTASSEIEHYERIQLDLPVDPFMLGHIALPAAHMLAEVLENATVFSEPGTPVHVSTGIDDTDVIITIADQGLGMSEEELNDANVRIRATSAGDVLGSQRLGLFVVGRIATRLGVKVELSKPETGNGTLVTVRFPHVLFVNPEALPMTPPSQAPVVETFVRPEEAAVVAHDSAYVPTGSGAWDVPAGAVGSAENPAEPIDLVELTDGTTGLGLPRRRARTVDEPAHGESDGSAASIPLAPQADSLAGAVQPRPGGDVWTPPLVPGPALSTRRPDSDGTEGATADDGRVPDQAGSGGLLARRPVSETPSTSGLPTRQPAPLMDDGGLDTASATGPVNVEGRTAIFAGFRSRRAELAAAAIHESGAPDDGDETPLSEGDGAERLAAAAAGGAASFFGRHAVRSDEPESSPPEAGAPEPEAPAQEDEAPLSRRDVRMAEPAIEPERPLVIPSLADDDEDFGDPSFAPDAPAPTEMEYFGTGRPEVDEPEQPWHGQAAQWPPTQDDRTPSATAAPAPWAEPPAVPAPEPWAAEPSAAVPAPEPWVAEPSAAVPAPEPWAAEPSAAPAPEPWAASTQDAPPTGHAPASSEVAPEPPAAIDFETLVEGPTRRSNRSQSKRRRLFGRSDKHSVDAQTPVGGLDETAPGFSPEAPTEAVAPFAGGNGPVRQSAWSSAEAGSHTSPEAPAPELEPEGWTSDAPAPGEPMPWSPIPVADTPVWAPDPAAAPEPTAAWGPPAPEPAAWEQPAPDHALATPAAWAPDPAAAPEPAAAWGPPAPEPVAWEQPAQEPVAWEEPAPEPPAPVTPAAWAPDPSAAPEPAAAWGPPAPVAPPAPATPAPVAPPAPATPAAWAPEAPPASNGAQSWAPSTPDWSQGPRTPPVAPAPSAPASPAPLAGQGQTFTPQMPIRTFDDEMTNMLAQRADIAQQALSELSQLSTYRPQAVSGGAQSLARRTPASVPAAPEIGTSSATSRPARDASQVRSLLSSFQSGTTRGREMAEHDASGGAHQTAGDSGLAGREEGSEVDRGQPVTTPDTDLDPRSSTW